MKEENRLFSLFNWLTHPSVPVHDPAHLRQIKLLSAVLLSFICISMIYASVQYSVEPEFKFGFIWISCVCLLLLGAYFLNRNGYYHWAAGLSLCIISVFMLGYIALRRDPASARYFSVLILPMVLGGILLNIRHMILLFLLNLIGAIVVTLLAPHVLVKEAVTQIAAFMATTAFLLLFIRHRNKVEKDRRAELKKREEQLQQVRKMESIGRLAGGIAHDFNNLLTVIIGHSEMLLHNVDRNPENEGIRESVEGVRIAAQRAAELTRQLLTFSRKQNVEAKLINLNQLVLSMKKMLVRLIGEHIRLNTRCTEDKQMIVADPSQIQQIVMNLVVNAADAMPQGGLLTVETGNVYLDESYCRSHAGIAPGNYVMLAVSDTGTGIDEETAKYIFEPFYTTKQNSDGTGLGLATVYGAVKQNKGHIWFYSEKDKGSTFKVYFPEASNNTSVTHQRDDLTEPMRFSVKSGVEKILLVEDEDGLRQIMKDVLEGCGYDVHTAANGDQGLEWLKNHREAGLQLLITDIIMPGIHGHQLAETFSREIPDIKILYISGYTDTRLESLGLDMRQFRFLPKPFSPLVLCRRVRELLDGE